MTETYWRWHRHHIPPFGAENAYSTEWGGELTPDGARYRPPSVLYCLCEACQDETGACGHDAEGECEAEGCECPGWSDCDRGYSCCHSADDLAAYFAARFAATEEMDRDGVVYEFEGQRHGQGIEGDPLVVPARVVRTLTWSQMLTETGRGR